MSTYGASPGRPGGQRPALGPQRAAVLQLVAGGLGVLSFIWGFLTWYAQDPAVGNGYLDGYALGSAGTAGIALSILAGAIAVGYALDGKTASAVPLTVAAAGLLTLIGLTGARSSSNLNGSVGMGIGMILTLVTTIVQVLVLAAAWLLGTGRIAGSTRRPAHPGYPVPDYGPATGAPYPHPQQPGHPQAGQPQPGYPPPQQPAPYSQPYGRPGGFGPPTSYGSGSAAQPTAEPQPTADPQPTTEFQPTTQLPRPGRPEDRPPDDPYGPPR